MLAPPHTEFNVTLVCAASAIHEQEYARDDA
jgi:hypothetical protein